MGEVTWLTRVRWFFQNWASSLKCRTHRRCTDQNRSTWPLQCVMCPLKVGEFESVNGFDAQEENANG